MTLKNTFSNEWNGFNWPILWSKQIRKAKWKKSESKEGNTVISSNQSSVAIDYYLDASYCEWVMRKILLQIQK